jgi:hypothetical protein
MEKDKTPAEMAVPRGQPVQIERVANGFIVREAFLGIGSGRMLGQPLVFNDLAGRNSLLDWLASHFESDADRERRVQQAQMELEMQRTHLECIAGLTHGGPIGPAPFAGFPPINPAPFDGSLLGTITAADPFRPCTSDAGDRA